MRRTERLFQIIQTLRSLRRPVTGGELAAELEVSLRTVYRDIAELVAQRVPIRGEAGIGYVIDSDFDMPPLMLTPDELEAAVLGASWVGQRGDAALARGALDLIAKLTAAIPSNLRPILLDSNLSPLTFAAIQSDGFDVSIVRQAIRLRRKLSITYRDADQSATTRRIWPVAIAYLDQARLIVAWCEMREEFRHFRTDRVSSCSMDGDAIPVSAQRLHSQWATQRETCTYPD